MDTNTLALALNDLGTTWTQVEDIGAIIDESIETLSQSEADDLASLDLLPQGSGYPTVSCLRAWVAFEDLLLDRTISFLLVREQWPHREASETARELMGRDLPLLAFRSLQGAGTGVWDADRLDAALGDCTDGPESTREALHHWLRTSAALVAMVDVTGGGTLAAQLDACAYRTAE